MIELDKTDNKCEIFIPRDKQDGYVNNKRMKYEYKFNNVFDQHTT